MKEKSYERIKNFSTEIPVSRTVAEIEKMLTKYGMRPMFEKICDAKLAIAMLITMYV